MKASTPVVGVYTGSESDQEHMQPAYVVLDELGIPYEKLILSAHRTPDRMRKYAKNAFGRGIRVIIAAAGGAAHLPGMMSAYALDVPVIGVPVPSKSSNVNDDAALKSIVQMPGGIPVATMAVGRGGPLNAALCAAAIIGLSDTALRTRLIAWRRKQSKAVKIKPKGS
jgi:5-(carboxyamino)imidazole ribonucleotide mutase